MKAPLLQKLCDNFGKLDSLNAKPSADSTYENMITATRSFNDFWNNHEFNKEKDPLLYALRERYGDMLDGFQALCSCTHEERNILLSHYVANVRSLSKKKIKTEQEKLVPVSGRSLRTYLNSLMRGMKMYEKEFGLAHLYGKDWSWSTSDDYDTFRSVYDTTISDKEFKGNRKIVHQPL